MNTETVPTLCSRVQGTRGDTLNSCWKNSPRQRVDIFLLWDLRVSLLHGALYDRCTQAERMGLTGPCLGSHAAVTVAPCQRMATADRPPQLGGLKIKQLTTHKVSDGISSHSTTCDHRAPCPALASRPHEELNDVGWWQVPLVLLAGCADGKGASGAGVVESIHRPVFL